MILFCCLDLRDSATRTSAWIDKFCQAEYPVLSARSFLTGSDGRPTAAPFSYSRSPEVAPPEHAMMCCTECYYATTAGRRSHENNVSWVSVVRHHSRRGAGAAAKCFQSGPD